MGTHPHPSGSGRSRLVRLVAAAIRSLRPRWTVRLRLTLVYGSLFLVSGTALLATTYVLVKHETGATGAVTITQTSGRAATRSGGPVIGYVKVPNAVVAEAPNMTIDRAPVRVNGEAIASGSFMSRAKGANGVAVEIPYPGIAPGKLVPVKQVTEQFGILLSEARGQQDADLRRLLYDSGIALLLMALLSVLLGWLVSGRALRPLRVITSKAQDISSTNLHERIALRGPRDEMKRLGDTFDDLLSRLEHAFEAQRQFVANASHELRTPLARQRTLLEVASQDPDADVDSLREASARAIAAGEEQEQLIEALLTLSSSERGLDHPAVFDLGDVARGVVESKQQEATLRGLDIRSELGDAPTTGNPRLAARLVANLVENALRYNEPRGWVVVTTSVDGGRAVVRVANSGPEVPDDEIERLFEPFQRLEQSRISREGHGLGLSIVRAVATAHGGTVTVTSRPAGGLDVRVAFPLGPAASSQGPLGVPLGVVPDST